MSQDISAADVLYPAHGGDAAFQREAASSTDGKSASGPVNKNEPSDQNTAAALLYPNQGTGSSRSTDAVQDTVPGNPEEYAFTFSDETQVDTELLGSFQKTAHELGISQGAAQKLAAMYEAHAAKARERAVEAQQKAIDEACAKWEAEIAKSPTFTQDREHIRSALRQYGDQELYDLIDQTNLGSHPKMWAFMAKVGRALNRYR